MSALKRVRKELKAFNDDTMTIRRCNCREVCVTATCSHVSRLESVTISDGVLFTIFGPGHRQTPKTRR